MASNGIHSLCDPRFLEAYHEKGKEATKKLQKTANANKASVIKKIEGVKNLHEKYGHESTPLFAKLSKEEF